MRENNRALKKANETYWGIGSTEPSLAVMVLTAMVCAPFIAISAAVAWLKRAVAS